MAQVVTNLLNNAAKYTEEGGEIWLSVARDVMKCDHRRDSGIGIPAELLSSVSTSLHKSTARSIDRKEAGIGLTLVRSLVELHRGS